jgi:RNA polymerase sigma factor (sigma-70 family)
MNSSQEMKRLLELYEKRLLSYLRRFVELELAREIAQESFLRCWQQGTTLAGREGPWLFKAARNLALDHLKREDTRMTQKSDGEKEFADSSEGAEESMARRQQESTLWNKVEQLPQPQREVLLLKFQENFSYKEISAITGHSVSYVGVLIHEGMTHLREHFNSGGSR